MTHASFVERRTVSAGKRDVKKVPFVELFDGRVQGVVSSGSDVRRVYVSYFEVETLNFYCSTNNNRPCGGVRGGPCKHLQQMLTQATLQYGLAPVADYLQLPVDSADVSNVRDILVHRGTVSRQQAGSVFSRFLHYLHYLELPHSGEPNHAMAWFVG